ncbi:serine/arginine repetitive matrix protein 1-like [Polyodon spathula]|uniref:serine/arginine repetitive matrix protein 1-like n=1 Tax=Polyodon spathula TaxID=7913 RepID=UPI001B7DBDF8|nr:serine/arginine repetitive matrix protein 1-like [Polyodon spathula]XP_041094276.1 serine/arginine repetitive matrix protein 1-like [Polyodon spathula]
MEPVRLTVEGYGGPPLQGAGKGSSNHGQERTRQQLRKHAPYVEREASSTYNTDKEKVARRKEPEESRSREPTSEANRRRLPQTQGLYQSPVKEAECSSRCESLLIPRQEAETRINRSPKRIGDSLSNGYRSGRLTVKTERPSGYRSPKQREADCTKSRSYQASQGRCPDMQEAGRLSMGSPLGSPGDRSPPPEPQRTHQESPEVSPAPPPCSPGPQTPDYPCTRHSECSNRREGCYYRQTAEYSQRHPPLGHNQEQLSSPGTRKRQLFRYSEEDPAEKHLNSVLGQPTLCNQALPPLIQVRAVYRGQGQAPQYSQQQQAPRHLIPQQQPLHQSHQQSQHRKSSSPDRRSRRM